MQNDFFCWGNASESSTSSNHTLHSVGEPSAKRPKLQLGAPSLNVIPRVKVNSDVTDLLRDDDKEECPDGSTIEVDTGHGLTGKIGVSFPYEPYPIQQKFVETLVRCLDSGGNALLESPTGTGKTACLLCGSISWQRQYSESVKTSDVHVRASAAGGAGALSAQGNMFDKQKVMQRQTSTDSSGGGGALRPKILYSSRTHSQLSQATKELKRATKSNSRYKGVKAVVIGSRDQLCLHPEVKQEVNSTVKTHMCRQKVRNGLCTFYNNFEKVKDGRKVIRHVTDPKPNEEPSSAFGFDSGPKSSFSSATEILDIEDLVKMGMSDSVCPYYYSREMSSTRADVIFMPYNYIIDPHTRKSHNVELTDNVVIFDEGHNIDSLCEESASFFLSSLEVASAFKETQKLLEKMAEAEKKFQGKENENDGVGVGAGANDSSADLFLGDESLTPDFNINDAALAAAIFHKLETILLDVHIKTETEGAVFKGSTIYSWLEDAGLARDRTASIISTVDQIASYLSGQQLANSFHVRPYGIMKMAEVLKQLYPDLGQDEYATYFLRNSSRTEFKMHLTVMPADKESKATGGSNSSDPWASKRGPTSREDAADKAISAEVKPRVLNYWCFSPAYAMKSVMQQRTRSVIITSGTLSPLASFELEMRTPFPWQLQNPHIVSPAQFFVAAVSSGPLGSKLSSVYSNRTSIDYLNDLGAFIANMSKLVPHGMLVFFPSYTVMTHCVERWKQGETWNRITQFKPVHMEPRDKGALADVMGQYTMDVRSRPDNKGAAFFAVCRGKVSEGLDFADINGRAVIITGLPYPPQMDPRVKLKMQYLDDSSKPKSCGVQSKNTTTPMIGASSSSKVETETWQNFDGRTWYQQQAVRAVNQAIGRVLRHKNDYGAILLCDERFSYSNNLAHLSSWIKPSVRHYKTFNTLPKDLTSFYKVAAMKYPYEETSSTVLPSAPDLKKPSPVKRNALTGTLEPRTPRPGIKKSNEVTHHIQKPDWMANLPIPQALRSTYLSQKDSNSSSLKPGQADNDLFNRLLSFDDETQKPLTSGVDQSQNSYISSNQIPNSQSSGKRKKIKIKGNIGFEGRDFIASVPTSPIQPANNDVTNRDETQKTSPDDSSNTNQNASTTAKSMFETAQSVLSEPDFVTFKRLIWRYRKEDMSFDALGNFIHKKLNLVSNEKGRTLRSMLKKYVKSKDMLEYEELCEKLDR